MSINVQRVSAETVEESFLKSLSLLEQAHRRLHDVVKDDLERAGERSLTGVQALLIYEIGEGKTPASALRARGAFAGTSLSYNVKKLQEAGYLVQERSKDDKRTVQLTLTPRGLAVRARVSKLFEKHASALEPTASVRP
ncbi:MAG: MarR family transcriptional regulator, partial [Pseudomonadota bacterium]